MKKISVLVLTISLCASSFLNAQDLLTPSTSFSKKKTSYITLTNGNEIKGNLEGIKYKKGLIKQIKITDGEDVTHTLKPGSVKHMYLAPSGLDKLSKATGFLHDASKWNNEKLNQDFLNQGLVYFETVNVKIKKKTLPMLMQLLNPTFSAKVKVYNDPYAGETASIGVAGVKVAGGIAKSYFMMLETDNAAYKISKKDYKKEYPAIWQGCSKLSSATEWKWSDLTKHIVEYTECE